MRLRYARPGYDADDLTLDGNLIAFDSASPGIFSVYTSGLWQGDPRAYTTQTKFVSWPALSFVPIVSIYISPASGSYVPDIVPIFLGSGLSSTYIQASGNYGLDVYNDGLYWRVLSSENNIPDHWQVWYWVHRMRGI